MTTATHDPAGRFGAWKLEGQASKDLAESDPLIRPGATRSRQVPSMRDGVRGLRLLAERHPYLLALVVICAATIAARSWGLFISVVDPDEGVYLVMAQQWLRGGLPYITVWDQHPPGLPALYAIGQYFVADPVLFARLAALAAVAATAMMIFCFCFRYARHMGAGLVGALLYIICISRWAGLAGNTEVFNNACVAIAAYLLFGAIRDRAVLKKALAAAIILGIGLQIKYVVLPETICLCLAFLEARRRCGERPGFLLGLAGLMILAGCLPTLIVAGYFWWQGALEPFLAANISSNITYVAIVPSLTEIAVASASGLLPLVGPVAVVLAVWLRTGRHSLWRVDPLLTVWVLLWTVAAVLDVVLPLKFFRHYYFALYPPVCLAAALVVANATRERRRAFSAWSALLLAAAAPLWVAGLIRAAPWAGVDVPRAIAQVLRDAGVRDMDLYVYGYHSGVYALAGVRPPTPYVMTLELAEFSKSARVDGLAEVRRVMAAGPRFVVKPAEFRGGRGAGALDDALAEELRSYRLIHEFVDDSDRSVVYLYERQSRPVASRVESTQQPVQDIGSVSTSVAGTKTR